MSRKNLRESIRKHDSSRNDLLSFFSDKYTTKRQKPRVGMRKKKQQRRPSGRVAHEDLKEIKETRIQSRIQQCKAFSFLDAKKYALDSDEQFYLFTIHKQKIATSRPRYTRRIDDIQRLISEEIDSYQESNCFLPDLKFAIIPAATAKEARNKFSNRKKIDVRLSGTQYKDRHKIRLMGLKPYYEEGKFIGWRGKIKSERWDEAAKFGSLTTDLEYTKQEHLKSIDSKRLKKAREIIKQLDKRTEEANTAYVTSKRVKEGSS